ncbi:hypothetical protein C4588_01590 [Candidatus Parcubacteria bacterium]|nr:MAG: hypothetical protein C4588_01590 [Candidatus Parcubacteria bacterium]
MLSRFASWDEERAKQGKFPITAVILTLGYLFLMGFWGYSLYHKGYIRVVKDSNIVHPREKKR